jgi:mannose-6-phosphate isomerase-like protein (cupin superfamily)
MVINVTKPERHEKAWGWEDWIINSSLFGYCGKILHFHQGGKFSLHFHNIKHESWYVISGSFNLITIDPDNAEKRITFIKKGDCIIIPQCHPHQLEALEESEIFECSTIHYETDSYRIEKGDSQKL